VSRTGIPKQSSDFHPSRTVDKNWLLRAGSKANRKKDASTRCPLFSDGRHRIALSPDGVRTRCLCGAER
jgi:hypothetical protein